MRARSTPSNPTKKTPMTCEVPAVAGSNDEDPKLAMPSISKSGALEVEDVENVEKVEKFLFKKQK